MSEIDTLDRSGLEALAAIEDPLGVLSVYVDADPSRQSSSNPPWALEIGNALADLRRRAREEGPRERWVALDERVEALQDDLDRLTDAARPGRGRALFAPLGGAPARSLSLQVPLETSVDLAPRARLRPLAAALDRWAPVGVVAVSNDGVRLYDLRLGEAREVGWQEFGAGDEDWREMKGPAGANPARSQQTAPQRDRFERRMDVHRGRFLSATATAVAEAAAAQGWDLVTVAGDARLTAPLVDALPAQGPPRTHRVELVVEGLPPHDLADLLADEIAVVRERRAAELVEGARDAALAGGRGALGPDDALAALEEGRVERLLLAERPEGASDRDRVERMIARALASGAEVTAVGGTGAEALAEHDGVAAVLRW